MNSREKEGLVKIANRESVVDTLIIKDRYPVIGYVSYLYFFPMHLLFGLKERIIVYYINRKS